MPTYQYQCLNCKSQFEVKQSFNDKPIADCPACHGVGRRLFCPVPIVFKGPGFYITDSRGGGGKSTGDSDS
jgi:putative FmdB family regulatory protein